MVYYFYEMIELIVDLTTMFHIPGGFITWMMKCISSAIKTFELKQPHMAFIPWLFPISQTVGGMLGGLNY